LEDFKKIPVRIQVAFGTIKALPIAEAISGNYFSTLNN
jgi:DNA-binding transcriptional regulator LsrR (DeoR family)